MKDNENLNNRLIERENSLDETETVETDSNSEEFDHKNLLTKLEKSIGNGFNEMQKHLTNLIDDKIKENNAKNREVSYASGSNGR